MYMSSSVGAAALVDAAIERAQSHLLACQSPDGHWVGELEANSTISSEYLLFGHLLDRVDREREQKIVAYLRRQQLPGGGFNLYDSGPANLSATIKAYFAMKVAGVPTNDPALVKARDLIHAGGGPIAADVFTKILLALFGEYDWSGVPAMPVEIMILPRWSYFNLLEVSYWSRTVIVPLLILLDAKPVKRLEAECRLDELWVVPREQSSLRFERIPRPFSPKTFLWKNFFIGVDDCLKGWERLGPRPFRARAVEAARQWLEERLAVEGGLGGIFPAMTNAVLALRTLGYPDDHPLIRGQLKEIENLGVETADSLHFQPCVSPVWDTALAANALLESGLAPDHPQVQRAAEWMMERQITVPGDWQAKRPHVPPGGWPFQYGNDFYPDLDDSAMVMMALHKTRGIDPERRQRAIDRGLPWFLGMQGSDGGWASFDVDNNRLIFNNIPFADHGALLDPSTEDLTGRGPRAPRHPRLRAGSPGGAPRAGLHPADPDARGLVVRPLGRELRLWHLVGPARARRHRRRHLARVRSPGGGVARELPELRRRLGRDPRLLRGSGAGRPRRLAPEPDGVGAARPLRRWRHRFPRRRDGDPLPPRRPSARTAPGRTRSGTAPGSRGCSI